MPSPMAMNRAILGGADFMSEVAIEPMSEYREGGARLNSRHAAGAIATVMSMPRYSATARHTAMPRRRR